MDDEPICGFEAHRHDSSCYILPDPVSQVRCSAVPHTHSEECDSPCLYADFFLHSHDTDYSASGAFVCSLQERKAHAHDEGCFTQSIPLICVTEESEGHTHGEECCTESTELTCTEPECEAHLHGEGCFDENGELVCEVPETEGHAHGEDCCSTVSTLICQLPEAEGHAHGEGCYGEPELVLICDKPVYIPHTHEDSCYSIPTAEGEEPVLICNTVELLEHIHDESCLAAVEVDPVPILICEKTEHEHNDGCFPPEDTTAATGETDTTLSTDPTETMDPTAPTDGTDPTQTTDVTDPTETTEVTEPVVLEVIEKVAVIYTDETYAEISTDTTVITVTDLIPADAEIRAYPVTVESEKEVLLDVGKTGIMGYIEIPSLDVELPIYHGTSDAVLQIAVGHLEWTSLPTGGEGTHCVLSGHRGLPSAKLFTHLDKLQQGDVFMLRVLDEILTYEVDQILIVKPHEAEDLQIVPGEDYCTLVTCTPYSVNSHRLLVRGHRIENEVAAKIIHVTSDAVQIEPILVAPAVAAPLLLILFISVLLPKRRGR